MTKEIEIPKGYEARIEGNKVIIEQKESEDERIRKWLIEEIKATHDYDSPTSRKCVDDAIAYLEKQKEPYSPLCNTIKDKIREYIANHFIADTVVKTDMKSIVKAMEEGVRLGKEEQKPISTEETELNSIAFLEQLGYTCVPPGKEQKPAEWSEDYREEDIQTRFAFYTYKDDPCVLYLSNVFVEEASRNHGFGTRILKAAEKAAEAIGAITICLKVKQDSPANAWYRKHGYGYVAFEDGYDWLEKNLEYLKPVKSAEWSDEDESFLDSIEDAISSYYDLNHAPQYHYWLEEKLKSLRPQPKQDVFPSLREKEIICLKRALDYLRKEHNRYGGEDFTNEIAVLEWLITHPILVSDTHWKPSEEQMEAFRIYLYHPQYIDNSEDIKIKLIESLYNDLKKLM